MPSSTSARTLRAFMGLLLGTTIAHAGENAPLRLQSGPARVSLIELFTSEGCSSCPPAEKWLGELRTAPGLWRDFVPVAFHVNYWDHLGWRDVLATKAFTERQHRYAAAWGASSVYTPGFVRDGAEWRPRSLGDLTQPAPRAGEIVVTWDPATGVGRVEYTTGTGSGISRALEASVAVLGGGIVSHVKRGENAGRDLRHEFVALQMATVPLVRQPSGGYAADVKLTLRTDLTAARRALAAWITPRGESVPLQAVGGWVE